MKFFICSLLLVLLASSAYGQGEDDNSGACDVCIGDGWVNEAAFFGDMPCSDWIVLANNTPAGVEACTLHRTAGAQFCGCNEVTETFATCYLCGDAASNAQANANKYIPDSPGASLTCEDMMEMPILDADTCPLIQEKYQHWCECPNAPQTAAVSCSFCEGGGEPNTDLDYPFVDGGLNCADLNDWYQVQSAESCPAVRESDLSFYLIDMQAYCQCPGREPPMVCQGSFCPSGMGIPTDQIATLIDDLTGVTCGDSSFLMEMITKEEDCELLYSTSDICCKAAGDVVFEATGGTSAATTQTPFIALLAAVLALFAW